MPADILIVPNRSSTTLNPNIQFSGSAVNTVRLEAQPSGSVAFVGNSGSLFSVVDNLSGSLMAVSDVSGLPILEVFSDDRVVMGKFNSNTLVVTGSRVGVGKAAPNTTFDVNGNTIISGSLTVGTGIAVSATSGEIRATNNITAYYSSDERLKTNIIKINNPLDKIKQIDGVLFDWNDTYKKQYGEEDGYFIRKQNSGVIAQQVEKVFPNVVVDRQDGYKAVRYELLVPLLIEAIKEQQVRIDELEKQLINKQ